MRFASIDRCRRGRYRRAGESQLCYFPRRQQRPRAFCRRLTAAAVYLACGYGPHAYCSAFAIATCPLLLLRMPLQCGSAALRIEVPLKMGRYHPRPRELRLVGFVGTMRMRSAFQLACWGGHPIFREKSKNILHYLINAISCFLVNKQCFSDTQFKIR